MSGQRVRDAFARRAQAGQPALVIYLTFGDPDLEVSTEAVVAAAEAGADVIELGVPFSDPNADGVVIQEAMERARNAGATLDKALAAVAAVRARGIEVPVVLFGYYNPIVARGVDRFAEDCGKAGVDAVLTVDVPMDELAELAGPLAERGVGVVPLVAPTSGSERIAAVKPFDPAFVYYVSMTGVTGGEVGQVADGAGRVDMIRKASDAPVAVGFGIRTADDAARVGAYADGVVVGSAVIRRLADGEPSSAPERVRAFVAELRAGCDRAR
jgi:tryptophan synthase alpha chain